MTKYFLPCLLFCNLGFCSLGFCNLAWAEPSKSQVYDVTFSATFRPDREVAEVSITVTQSTHALRLLDFTAPESEFLNFSGDGTVLRDGKHLIWTVPDTGGTLHYDVRVEHERGLLLDARMTDDWAILRLDDLFPPARVRSRVRSVSNSQLELQGPPGWLFESRYGPVKGTVSVTAPDRRFDRPTGWLAAGKLGVRREKIAGRRVTIAAPQQQGMRRLDIIAFLNWTMPKLVKVFPNFPDRLLIVGAQDDMWRGGLSGPDSIYLHSDRPLISENATSALLHELVHTATNQVSGSREDWIIEGLAEYYSLTILRRSGGISKKRFEQAINWLDSWAQQDRGRLVSPSSGANTARAVGIFMMIQDELAANKAGSLDSVIRKLLASGQINCEQLLSLTEAALGGRSQSLRDALSKYSAPSP